MIALTAYGVRKANKAYKKRKAEKDLQKVAGNPVIDPSDELLGSRDVRPVSGGMVNYSGSHRSNCSNSTASSQTSQTSQERPIYEFYSPTRSQYTDSAHDSSSAINPMDSFRKYQQYIERQSGGYLRDLDAPPSYDAAVGGYQPPSRQHFPNTGTGLASMPAMATNSPYYLQPQGLGYGAEQENAARTQPYSQQPVPPPQQMGGRQVISEVPDTGTYRVSQVYSIASEPEPMSAVSELAADVPMPLKARHATNGLGGPQRFELPAPVEETEMQNAEGNGEREMMQRHERRKRSGSETSGEEDSYENDLAKTYELS